MVVYAVDVGTTNLKVVLYDRALRRLAIASAPASYDRSQGVEFDPEALFDTIVDLIGGVAAGHPEVADEEAIVALTGQAESLVLTDGGGRPVRAGMSWLDERAAAQARELEQVADADTAFAITGEPFPSATWPAAKLRWLREHEPASLAAARRVLMVKDYLVLRFSGTALGEVTTRGFTYLWDVRRGRYWGDMVDHCGISTEALPEVVPAGTDVGPVAADVADRLPPARGYRVNVAALDHFCAMAGTGRYVPGAVSESAGTVLSVSMLRRDWQFDPARKASFHTGLRDGDTILFHGADSGGVVLEWFRREGLGGLPYAELEARLAAREPREAPLFLPYLTGINPPDFFADARGAFLGLQLSHTSTDLAFAVEEGVAHLLRRNVDDLDGGRIEEVVSTGGGSASAFWNQLKADVCGVDVVVPDEAEATCRGAAILALVAAGELGSIDDARDLAAPAVRRFTTHPDDERRRRYALFDSALTRLYRD